MDEILVNYLRFCKKGDFVQKFDEFKSLTILDINYQNENSISFLLVAVAYKHIEGVKWLLDAGADPNLKDKKGQSCLYLLRTSWCLEMVQLLLTAGADVNSVDSVGNTPIAVHIGFQTAANLDFILMLLRAGGNPSIPNNSGKTCFDLIENHTYGNILRLLFSAKDNLNLQDPSNGYTLLHYAVSYQLQNLVKYLLFLKADPNISNNLGNTPLHLAVTIDLSKIKEDTHPKFLAPITELFSHGVDLNRQNLDGDTPLHIAVKSCSKNYVKHLMSLGADQNIQNSSGNTALHIATDFESKHLFSLLRNDSINLDLQNAEKKTALDLAICNGKMFATSLLLSFGANMEIRGEYGYSAIHWAVHKSSVEALQLLIQFRADLNLKTDFGFTALHLSVLNHRLEIIKLLCKSGVDLNSQDNYEDTPLHLAVKSFDKGVEILIDSGANLFIENNCRTTAVDYLTKRYLSTMKRLSSTCQQTIADRIAIKLTPEQESCIN